MTGVQTCALPIWRIARKLGISENTVRIYVSEVLHRLGHTSRTELIAAALGN